MRTLSLRFIVAVITFFIGVSIASVWLFHQYSQSQMAKSEITAEPKIPADTLITLQRTGCYGSCPSYTLTVAADGTVVFNATAYWAGEGKSSRLKQSGIIMSKVSQEQVSQLISEFERAGYFSLGDSYTSNDDCLGGVATDLPSAYTSIQVNGRRKAISHNYGCVDKGGGFVFYPRQLIKLEKRIDEIVNTEQWMQ